MTGAGNPIRVSRGTIMDTAAAKQTLADIEARHADTLSWTHQHLKELHDMGSWTWPCWSRARVR